MELMAVVGENKRDLRKAEMLELRRLLSEMPDLWHDFSLARMAAMSAVEADSNHTVMKEFLMANYNGMRRELGYAQATWLEKPLIEHVALCWWRLQALEQRYSRVMSESIPLTLGQYWEKRLSAAQRRYLRACTTLARIRKMGLPAMQVNVAMDGGQQVNIAEQQVNVAKGERVVDKGQEAEVNESQEKPTKVNE